MSIHEIQDLISDFANRYNLRTELEAYEDECYNEIDRIDSILVNVGGYEQLSNYFVDYSSRASDPLFYTRYDLSNLTDEQMLYYTGAEIIASSAMMIPTENLSGSYFCKLQLKSQLFLHFGPKVFSQLTGDVIAEIIGGTLDPDILMIDSVFDMMQLLLIVDEYVMCRRAMG